MSNFHTPVMLKEVLEYLDIKSGSWYVDCNLGGGGHTKAILDHGGNVIGIDLDPDAIKYVVENYKQSFSSSKLQITNDKNGLRAFSENLILVQGNFANLDRIVHSVILGSEAEPLPSGDEATPESISDTGHSIDIDSRFRGNDNRGSQYDNLKTEIATSPRTVRYMAPRNDISIAGILFDLGISSHQMDEASRGFSFSKDGPLDMRMDRSKPSANAADLVNGLHEGELAELFLKLGEESFAKPIARRIIQSRKASPITTTFQLAQIVESVKKRKPGDKLHPATQIFQALRIAVNDELNNLKEALPKAFEILEPGGRLVVISFHSLEDRIVKEFIKGEAESGKGKVITKKPDEPSEEEVLQNPRARSSKLRVLEKL